MQTWFLILFNFNLNQNSHRRLVSLLLESSINLLQKTKKLSLSVVLAYFLLVFYIWHFSCVLFRFVLYFLSLSNECCWLFQWGSVRGKLFCLLMSENILICSHSCIVIWLIQNFMLTVLFPQHFKLWLHYVLAAIVADKQLAGVYLTYFSVSLVVFFLLDILQLCYYGSQWELKVIFLGILSIFSTWGLIIYFHLWKTFNYYICKDGFSIIFSLLF